MWEALSTAWAARWSDTPPVGFLAREFHRDRWVRFHTLPESKRYPDSEREYETILGRHRALLRALGAQRCFVTAELFRLDGESSVPPAEQALLPGATYWRTVPPTAGEEMAIAVYATEIDVPSAELDVALRPVIDDERLGGLIVPPDDDWLYLPYDGGADVIAASPRACGELRSAFSSWLSTHPRGL